MATTVVAASLLWVNPARVNADPVGWRLLFSAAFDRPPLPTQCEPYDGPHEAPAANYYRPDEVAISDGALRLGMHRRDFSGRPYTTGGVRCLRIAQQYGRYEFRARAPLGTGINAYVTLSPVDRGAGRDASRIEIRARPGDESLYLSNQYGLGETSRTLPGSYSADYHTYLVEWAPSGFRVAIDNQERLVDAHVSTTRRWLGLAVSSGDPRTGVPDSATALPAEFLVDWIRVWSYDPAASVAKETSAPPGAAATGPAVAGQHWSGWLAGVAVAALVLVAGAYAVRRTRPRRPPPSHRA